MAFSTILLTLFMVMFWMFRAIVAVCTQYSIDIIGIVSYNLSFEIVISFIVLVCIILVIKRKLIGALIYTLLYGMYFGQHFLTGIISIAKGNGITMDMSVNLVCDLCAIALIFFCLLDMIADRNRKTKHKDGKTDWYFNNKKYDEELEKKDSRDDKNEYKFY